MVKDIAIKKGYKQTELGVIPEDWEVKKLNEYLDYEQPTEYLVADTEYNDNNQTPVLTAGKTFILGYTNEENGIFNKLPVIIFDDFTTAIKFVDFPFKVKSSAMKMLLPKNNKVNMRFVYEKMLHIKYPLGDHKRHWIGEYQHLEIIVPASSEEQTAIATVLSDTDALIEKLEKLIIKKKAIKQGAMQQLLTGKKRLPGFSGEWEMKELKVLVDFSNGKAHEKFISDNGEYIVANSKFISTEGRIVKYSNQCFSPVSAGSILMVMSDVPNGKAIAKCFLVDKDDKYTVNQRICALKPKIDSIFLYYKINRNPFYLSFDDGVKQTNLRKDDVLECKINIPNNRKEQIAIATILSDMDFEIEKLEQKRNKYIMLKQGMMQQLLTGRIRIYANN